MTRLLPLAIVCTLALSLPQTTHGRSPDQVPHSPIPPLESPHKLNKAKPAAFAQQNLAIFSTDTIQETPLQLDDTSVSNSDQQAESDASPTKLWDSPAMRDARQAVIEFCRYSAQTSPAACDKFLEDLSQLSPEKMQDWLNRYQRRQKNIATARQIHQQSRRSSLQQTVQRLQARRQRAATRTALQNQAIKLAGLQNQQTSSKPFSDLNVASLVGRSYNPFEVVIDPSSPRGINRLRAASIASVNPTPESNAAGFTEPLPTSTPTPSATPAPAE